MFVDPSYEGGNLVFLVGCPRSGTTWLQRLLSSHPGITTGQESHLFNFYIGPQLRIWNKMLDPAITGRGGVGIGCYTTADRFRTIVRKYMLSLLGVMLEPIASNELFLDKTPAHALYIPEIHQLLPRARFIHILRDPRDVVASLLAASRGWGAGWAPRTPARAAMTWKTHVEAVRESASNLPVSQFIEVRYEELHERPEHVLRRIIEFLGLEWSEGELQAAIEANRATSGGTEIPLRGALAGPGGVVIEPEGFVRRASRGGWTRDLSWKEKITVRAIAWRLMAELGYAPPPGPLTRKSFSMLWALGSVPGARSA